MRINLLTAKPALELMLASNGHEAPYENPLEVWKTFVHYLSVPADASRDVACFQCSLVTPAYDETETSSVFLFGRQLSDEQGETRWVQLVYTLGNRFSHHDIDTELWSDDFPDLTAFTQAVEATPQFTLLCEDFEPSGELFVEFVD